MFVNASQAIKGNKLKKTNCLCIKTPPRWGLASSVSNEKICQKEMLVSDGRGFRQSNLDPRDQLCLWQRTWLRQPAPLVGRRLWTSLRRFPIWPIPLVGSLSSSPSLDLQLFFPGTFGHNGERSRLKYIWTLEWIQHSFLHSAECSNHSIQHLKTNRIMMLMRMILTNFSI